MLVHESGASRRYSETRKGIRLERIFWVQGTDDPDIAVAAGGIPQLDEEYGSLGELNVKQRQVEVARATGDETEGVCKVTVVYESPERSDAPPSDQPEFELSTVARTEHIVRAIEQWHFPPSADVGALIGVNGADVAGVDIYVPKVAYREVRERSDISPDYRRILTGLTAKVNDGMFKGWDAGEVLFLGATARRRGTDPWRVEYTFAAEPNETLSIETVSGVVDAPKNGWDYLWYTQAKIAGPSDTEISFGVESAHVAQVYEQGNFALLGIGS